MTIEKITDHVDRRIARLATQFRESYTRRGLVAAAARQLQDVENALYGLLALRSLANAQGVHLDRVGQVLGVEREGRSDDRYRLRLQAQVLVNRRSGEIDTVLRLLRLLLPESTGATLTEYPPAAFVVEPVGTAVSDPEYVHLLLRDAKAGGVRAQFRYSAVAAADTFTLGDVDTAPSSTQGLGDTSAPAVGGQLAGII